MCSGIWQFPGVLAQPASGYVTYTTGDTVFVDVPSRDNADADPSFIEYTYYVHKNHMPGTYWCAEFVASVHDVIIVCC